MEFAYLSARQLARLIQNRETTSVALLEYFLARQAAVNPTINAVVVDNRDAARLRAAAADKAFAQGENWGPLHGIPMTVKETFEMTGLPTTGGIPALAGHVSAFTAPAVQRLLDAGAVIFGKTNTPAFASDIQTYNEIYGTTSNPWDPSRTPGGSSGGAAAALAAGLTPLELGSDIGGSIRTPAAFCGVYGHKPSWGIIPSRGHVPGPPGTLADRDLAVVGPMARDIDDLELAMDLLAGPDETAAVAWQVKLPRTRHRHLGDFRVAAWIDDPSYPIDHEIAAGLQHLVGELERAKVPVDRAARPEGVTLAGANHLYYQLLAGVMSVGAPPDAFAGLLERAAQNDDPTGYPTRFAQGATQYHATWLAAHEQRLQMGQAWKRFFDHFDVMLCPAVQVLAFPHLQEGGTEDRVLTINGEIVPYLDTMVWAGLAGVVFLPATVIPIGRSETGLPMGIQIIAPYLEDHTALTFARHLAKLTGGFEPPPGY